MNSNPRRLYRSADDRILAGVAGGLAAYFDVDPVIVRVIWFLSVFLSGSLTFWAYLVMIVVVPLEPADWTSQSSQSGWTPSGGPAGPAGYAASYVPPFDPAAGAARTEPGTPSSGPEGTPTPTGPDGAAGGPNAAGFASVPGGPSQSWGDWRSQRQQERWQRHAERWQQREAGRERRGPGLMIGIVLIVIGGLLAAHQIDPSFDLNVTWPIVLIVIGGLITASSVRFKRD